MRGMNFEGFSDTYDESARLCILRCLAEQGDYRLTDSMLNDLMSDRYAINKGRAYVRTQLAWLEQSAGAVKLLRSSEPVVIAVLTEAGADHVLMRSVLPGIKRPSAGGR